MRSATPCAGNRGVPPNSWRHLTEQPPGKLKLAIVCPWATRSASECTMWWSSRTGVMPAQTSRKRTHPVHRPPATWPALSVNIPRLSPRPPALPPPPPAHAANRLHRQPPRPPLPPAANCKPRKPIAPPGFSSVAAAASNLRCPSTSPATSFADLRCGTSGCRRIVPVAEHGASSSTASNNSAGDQSAASACTISTSSRRRAMFSRSRATRRSSRSTAMTCAPAAASCAVLPPGAAHKSATRSPRCAPSSKAGNAAAASWTQKSPASKAGNSVTRVPAGYRHDPVGNRTPPSGAAAPGFSETSRGASPACPSAMLRASLPQLAHNHARRIQPRPIQLRQQRRPLVRHTTQHRVHHLGERCQLLRPGQIHRRAHGGVRRGAQKKQLCCAHQQDQSHRHRRRARDKRLYDGVQRPKPPQHAGGYPVRRSPVARFGWR